MFSGASVLNANVASWNTARVANLAAEGADARFAQCSNAEGEGRSRGRRERGSCRELVARRAHFAAKRSVLAVAPEP
jgi:surface protein